MVWVRLDDNFDEHPKVVQLDDHALALFVCGLAYCNRNLTDGFIPTTVGRYRLRLPADAAKGIAGLEAAGLWDPVEDGWRVHDYQEYQPCRDAVLADRARNAERQRRYRHTVSNGVTDSVTDTVSSVVSHGRTRPVSRGVSHPGTNAATNGEVTAKSRAPRTRTRLRRTNTDAAAAAGISLSTDLAPALPPRARSRARAREDATNPNGSAAGFVAMAALMAEHQRRLDEERRQQRQQQEISNSTEDTTGDAGG